MVSRWWRRARSGLRRPEVQTDLLQVVKAVVATVVAWLLAVRVLGLEQGFLAAWAALLTIHATVYRTFWRGAQSVVATLLGIVLSYLATAALGFGAASLGAAVLVGLLLARTPLIKEEGIAVATTALFVITSGAGTQEALLLDRFLDTLIGVGVGVVVNVLLLPPLDDRIAERALDRAVLDLGRLLERMAAELRHDMAREGTQAWVEETRDIDARLDRAQEHLSFTQESQWANVRRRRSRRTADVDQETELLIRLEEGVAQARAIARVVDESVVEARAWDDGFRDRWTDLLRRVGRRVADPYAEVEQVRPDLDRLTRDLSGEELPSRHWPVYGALITTLLNITTIVDDVASHRDELRPRP
ncbi:FUSC family protein [Nocardioides coralli]|uniref:FUSC family protein n=1 Tax=Nocardioides coralli TaxID=2872154 RepID=UPI001CA402B0|nr:aromatic acid exporter family protein [Nocardioides coralli]QZY30134.1 FUSC family protein [Nocardioides coralli]